MKYIFIGISFWAMSLTQILAKEPVKSDQYVPYIVIDLSGGAALPGNFLVGGEEGPHDLLDSYDTLGWNPYEESWFLDFGIPMASESSHILRGILNAYPSTDRSLRFATICHRSRDDSSYNPLSAIHLVNRKMRTHNFFFPNGLGSRASIAGGRQSGVHVDQSTAPRHIDSLTSAERAFLRRQLYNDDAFMNAFRIGTENQIANDKHILILFAALRGYSPSGVVELHGFDYHGLGHRLADRRDFTVGQVIGAIASVADSIWG